MNDSLRMDRQRMRLGKLAPKVDARTLRLESYAAVGAPRPPKEVDWSKGIVDWGAMLNDEIADCTCAAPGHLIQEWTANASAERTLPDSDILAAYEAVSGYDPADPSTDKGAAMLDVLSFWRQKGIGGHRIQAYAALNPLLQPLVQLAIDWFGGIYVGLQMPLSAQDETVWAQGSGPDGQAGSWGGHAVAIFGYDGGGPMCVTWGRLQRMTWGFFSTYCDEAYAVLEPGDWAPGGDCPAGLNLAALAADLKVVTG